MNNSTRFSNDAETFGSGTGVSGVGYVSYPTGGDSSSSSKYSQSEFSNVRINFIIIKQKIKITQY